MATKRMFDLVVSLLLIFACIPILIFVYVAILILNRRNPIFVQVRAGLDGLPFRIQKFRTMSDAVGPDGAIFPDEKRITSLGSLLRRTSIDELPELFNILKGDMSFVGPRPLYLDYVPLYNDEQRRRLAVKPGLTGWAQVNGRNALSWEERFEMDVWYVDNRSFLLDIKILLRTFAIVVKGTGVSQEGHATMTRFTGSKS